MRFHGTGPNRCPTSFLPFVITKKGLVSHDAVMVHQEQQALPAPHFIRPPEAAV